MGSQIDVKSLSAEEQRLYKLYGKLPSRADLLQRKANDRKYFDSGDYALNKAGHSSAVGSKIPNPDSIPRNGPPMPSRISRP